MKKLFTLLAAAATAMAMNAASVNWTVADLDWPRSDNNKPLAGETLKINDNLSLTFSDGESTSPVIYRNTSNDSAPYINLYSKTSMTLTATNATITSITFVVDEAESKEAPDAVTTQPSPGWKVKIGSATYSIESPTWTGSETSVEITDNSKATLLGLNIEYTVTGNTPAPEPGEESTLTWSATSLSELANNDVLDGMSFDINDVLSFTLANNGGDKDVIFKKTSSAPTTINLYSKNSIAFAAAEGTTIKSIKFIVNTSEGTSNTPGWTLQDEAKNSYDATKDTWTGEVSAITFTDKSAAQLMGLEIVYVTAGNGDNGGGDDNGDDTEYENAALFFSEELVGSGEMAQDVTLNDNGTSVHFTSNSASAQIDANTFNYGTAAEYDAIKYRYRPGGKSTQGVNSANKGVFTFPCAGTLYIYAFNNQDEDRNLQLIQDGETIFDHLYKSTDCETIPGEGDDAVDIKIYPIYNVEVAKGTATLLWPVNQVMLSGFEFVPANTPGDDGGDENVAVEIVTPDNDKNAPAYDLFGRQVGEDYRGIYIQNGKKYIRR